MSNSVWPLSSGRITTSSGRIPALSRRTTRVANLWQLTHNELFMLRRRRLIWVLLSVNLLFVLSTWIVLCFYAGKNTDIFLPGHLLAGPDALANALGQPMALGRRAGEFIAIILAGIAFGGEFSSGAIRLALSRGVRRSSYLFAKYLALAIICLALVIASVVISLLFVNVLILLHNPAPTVLDLNGHTLLSLLLMMTGSYGNYLFCLLFGAAFSILARSALFGITVGSGYLILEDVVAQLLPFLGRSTHMFNGNQIVNLLFTPNLNAFYISLLPGYLVKTLDRINGVVACVDNGCLPVGTGQSLLVSCVWVLVLASISTYLFITRDVLQ